MDGIGADYIRQSTAPDRRRYYRTYSFLVHLPGGKRKVGILSDKEIIDGANALALQFFTAYNRMLQLTGNSEEALKLTNSLFEAMFAGNRPRPEPGAGGFTLYWDRR